MPRPIVLLIHGMGTHSTDSTTLAFTTGITEGANFLGLDQFSTAQLDIVEFNYSETLDEIRAEIAEHARDKDKIIQILQAANGITSIAGDIVDWQTKLDGDEFLYTHLLDVLLYATTYHGVEISIRLSKKILELMNLAKDSDRTFHIVAHSLGTKVTTDALWRLFANDVGIEGALQIDPAVMRPMSLWMISNVSRLVGILDPLPDPYQTIVIDGQNGCTGAMYNTSNKFDPFTWFLPYKRKPSKGYNIAFDDVRKIPGEDSFINPHSLTEYFAYPETTRAFLKMTLNSNVTPANYRKALTAYKKTTVEGAVITTLEEIKDAIHISVNEDASIKDKINFVIQAYTSLKDIKERSKKYFSVGGHNND